MVFVVVNERVWCGVNDASSRSTNLKKGKLETAEEYDVCASPPGRAHQVRGVQGTVDAEQRPQPRVGASTARE